MPENNYNRKCTIAIILSIAAVILFAAGLYAGIAGRPGYEQSTISVSGTSSQLVIPDTASISIGVITRSMTAKDASDKNGQVMNAVITVLKNTGLEDREIRTSILYIQPVYNVPKEGGVAAITGYSASNNVEITTKMLDKLGDVVDRSVASGANQVSGITFMLSDEKEKQIRDELLSAAVEDADSRANKLAENLNVKIAGVKTSSISESGSMLSPVSISPEKSVAPVLPGESRVTLSVQVTYVIE